MVKEEKLRPKLRDLITKMVLRVVEAVKYMCERCLYRFEEESTCVEHERFCIVQLVPVIQSPLDQHALNMARKSPLITFNEEVHKEAPAFEQPKEVFADAEAEINASHKQYEEPIFSDSELSTATEQEALEQSQVDDDEHAKVIKCKETSEVESINATPVNTDEPIVLNTSPPTYQCPSLVHSSAIVFFIRISFVFLLSSLECTQPVLSVARNHPTKEPSRRTLRTST